MNLTAQVVCCFNCLIKSKRSWDCHIAFRTGIAKCLDCYRFIFRDCHVAFRTGKTNIKCKTQADFNSWHHLLDTARFLLLIFTQYIYVRHFSVNMLTVYNNKYAWKITQMASYADSKASESMRLLHSCYINWKY